MININVILFILVRTQRNEITVTENLVPRVGTLVLTAVGEIAAVIC